MLLDIFLVLNLNSCPSSVKDSAGKNVVATVTEVETPAAESPCVRALVKPSPPPSAPQLLKQIHVVFLGRFIREQ